MNRLLMMITLLLGAPQAIADQAVYCCKTDDSAKMKSGTAVQYYADAEGPELCTALGWPEVSCDSDDRDDTDGARTYAACDLLNNPGKYHHESPAGNCTNGSTGNLQSIKAQFSVCPAVNGKDQFDYAMTNVWFSQQDCEDDDIQTTPFNQDCTVSWLESNVCPLAIYQQ